MELGELRKLVRLMREHDLVEVELQDSHGKVRLVRRQADTASRSRRAAPAPAVPAAGQERSDGGAERQPAGESWTIVAPMVGTFYRAPSPDAPPFVEVGQVVEPGDVLCIIEAMKMMNEIEAERRGRVVRILVENGSSVEYGSPLFVFEPA